MKSADKRFPGPELGPLGQRRRTLLRGRPCCLCTVPSTRHGAGASTSCHTLPRAAGTHWRSACAGRRVPGLRTPVINESEGHGGGTCGMMPAQAHTAALWRGAGTLVQPAQAGMRQTHAWKDQQRWGEAHMRCDASNEYLPSCAAHGRGRLAVNPCGMFSSERASK